MNENQCVAGAMCDECGCDNRLAKGRRGCEHAAVVGNESIESPGLWPSQSALERDAGRQRRSIIAMIVQNGDRPVTLNEFDSFVEAAARQSNMSRMELGARDDPRLAECRQTHCLRAIEFRVLERCQANELRNQGRRKFCPVDVDLISDHDPDLLWYRSIDTPWLTTA